MFLVEIKRFSPRNTPNRGAISAVRSADLNDCPLARSALGMPLNINVRSSRHRMLLEIGLLDLIDRQALYHVDLQCLL